ncbi:type II toxin-antitoxin system PemK/MazF family toxin [Pseudomonas aeruginosa]
MKAPEIVKRRPAIVISPKLRGRKGLCTVVPISTTEPHREMEHHFRLRIEPALPNPYCSGQPIPDSGLSFSSATAGGNPSLN